MSGVAVGIESARPPDKCVQHRNVSGAAGTAGATAGRTPVQKALVGRSGRLSSHRLTRHRQHCLVVSGGRCELGILTQSTRRVLAQPSIYDRGSRGFSQHRHTQCNVRAVASDSVALSLCMCVSVLVTTLRPAAVAQLNLFHSRRCYAGACSKY